MPTSPSAWAERQCAARAAQGLDPAVTDPAVLTAVSDLLAGGR